MATSGGTSRLNTYLQKIGSTASVSWVNTRTGPSDARVWTCVCKIDGEARGQGTASLQHVAKDLAADEALATLTGNDG